MEDYKVIQVKCDAHLTEMLIAEIATLGFDGFIENEQGFETYILEKFYNEDLLKEVTSKYEISNDDLVISTLPQQNWNANWESSFEPVIVSDKLIVKAPFHQISQSYQFEIIIQPKNSFGTGHHETTQSIMELMLELDFKDKTVFDYGCGTGVLSILASKLGAKSIFANDIDDWAYDNIGENISFNHVTNIEFKKGDLSIVPTIEFDVILANINKNILLRSFELLSQRIKNGGLVFLSGFYENDLNDLTLVAKKFGLVFSKKVTQNNWCAAILMRES